MSAHYELVVLMRFFYTLFFITVFIFSAQLSLSQNSFTGLNGTTISVPCGATCNTLQVKVPHLKTSSEYTSVTTSYTPEVYTTPTGNELTSLYIDDKYSPLISLPFPVCFYDSTYNNVVVGSNGMITFNASLANGSNGFTINNSIPSTSYPSASVFGIHTDLNPNAASSPNDKKIEWRIAGVAPFRKFIVSYYHIGMYMSNNNFSCSRDAAGNPRSPTTFQIILYEQTGLIDVFIESKTCNTTTTGGRAILGVQNWQRNKAFAATGKNAAVWPTIINEGYRFIPSGSASRFIRSEIYDLNNVLLQTTTSADTATTTPGFLDLSFPNVCFTGGSKDFIIKTYYSSCPTGGQLMSTDTITVSRGNVAAQTSSTPASCGPTGSTTISLPAGTVPYTFSIGTNPPITTSNNTYTFTGLVAGTYTLTAADGSGCGATSTVTVGLNSALNILATATAPTCSGLSNGTVTINPQNGTAPYQYNINNGSFQTGNQFSNLSPGTYMVGAKDFSGCVIANYSVIVPAGVPVTATSTSTNVSCNGGSTGSISVTASANAAGPVQYSLDGNTFQLSNTFTNLIAGSYTVYFKDAFNCGGTINTFITQPSLLSQVITTQDVTCNGQSNGKITVAATGGTPAYQYSLDGITYQLANSFAVAAGVFTVYVKDAAGCIKTGSVTINQPSSLRITSQTQNASCNGGADGTITATASGGTIGYQYSINGTSYQSSNVFRVAQGAYTIYVKDANGCTATVNDTVRLLNNLTLRLSADTTICEGLTAPLTATSNATQYLWSPAGTLDDATRPSPVASPKDTTQYVLTATLGVCTIKDSVQVAVLAAPVANAGSNNEICFGQNYLLQGSGGVSYAWSPAAYFDVGNTTSMQNPAVTPPQTTTYTLLVTDANGCVSLQPASVSIKVTPPIRVSASPRDTVVARGDVFQLRAISPVPDYLWSPSLGLDNAASQNPIATVTSDITYTVTAYTGAGCKGTDTVRIRIYNGPEVYVPTAFTPNSDGRNDILKPFPVGIKELHFFRVYNRWGQIVYQTNTLSAGWDGKVSGSLQPMATYIWVLEAVTKENKIITKKGTTTLIR